MGDRADRARARQLEREARIRRAAEWLAMEEGCDIYLDHLVRWDEGDPWTASYRCKDDQEPRQRKIPEEVFDA